LPALDLAPGPLRAPCAAGWRRFRRVFCPNPAARPRSPEKGGRRRFRCPPGPFFQPLFRHQGRAISDFARAAAGLALGARDDPALGCDLIRALLAVAALDSFARPQFARVDFGLCAGLRWPDFLQLFCEVSGRYQQSSDPENGEFLRLLMVLILREYDNPELMGAIAAESADALHMALGRDATPLFGRARSLAVEALAVFSLVLKCRADFPEMRGCNSNNVLCHILAIAETAVARGGIDEVVDLAVVTIGRMLRGPAIAALARPTAAARAEPEATYGDLLLDVLLRLCERRRLWAPVVRILHAICGDLTVVSEPAADGILCLFHKVMAADPAMAPLFLEVFALVIQKQMPIQNSIRLVIFTRGFLFNGLKQTIPGGKRALGVILAFLKAGKGAARATKKPVLHRDELAALLCSIDIAASFPAVRRFAPSQREEIVDDFWAVLVDRLVALSFPVELPDPDRQ
jgi:hypothetical protein